MVIAEGSITALYLFDVAEEADLAALPRLLQAEASPARLAPKPFTPAYVQYQQPPIVLDGEALQLPGRSAQMRVRVKVFDYGIISFAVSEPVSGGWDELASAGQRLGALEAQVQGWCDQLRRQLTPCLVKSRQPRLSEDYLVYAVTRLEPGTPAHALIAAHGDAIVSLLLGERQPLSRQQRERVLRRRISYLADDLVIPTWNAAFVCDTEAGVQAALEIFEFANSQLLQFRYYDALLDSELERIYDSLEDPRWYHALTGQRYVRAARQLHALFIDVNELTDKTENALKMVGDVYAARLYSLVASRLGLDRWKQNVEEKLDTLDDIYRFTVDQTQMSRGHLLELTIILILILELILVFMGIME
jgi:hypothetical protein